MLLTPTAATIPYASRLCFSEPVYRSEDPQVGIRYLENIVIHPDDLKYRKIRKTNRFERKKMSMCFRNTSQ